MLRLSLLAMLALPAIAPAADYPTATLKNEHVRLTVLLPGANSGYYRGSRFDWSGLVSRVEFGKHVLFQEWKSPHDPAGPDDVGGTAEEFGMLLAPLGYADAKKGGRFLKIGIGQLERPDDKEYQFNRPYKIVDAAPWTVEARDNRIVFRQAAELAGGFSYEYVKRVRLADDKPEFVIERELKNTGKKAIHTDHYGHNFLSFDGKPVGPDYRLTFTADPKPRAKRHDLAAGAKLSGKELNFDKELLTGTIYTELEGFGSSADGHAVTATDLKSGFGLTITGDAPVKEWHVWAIKTALCPEPFVEIKVEPGDTFKWSTKYVLFGKKE